jgi:carboxylesterase type B
MTASLFLNSPIEKLARAAIFESGSAATFLTFNAERRQVDWENFVGGVPSCASLANSSNTFSCLQNADTSEIFEGLLSGLELAPEEFGFGPTIDGPGGLYPDIPSRLFAKNQFAKLPFIAGTNLDEGTIFTPKFLNSEELVHESIIANFTPPVSGVSAQDLEAAAEKLLQLYPNDPSLGSPFGTGNQTFGLSPVFKQAAALNGDISFQSQRRFWIQTASKAGVKTFGYLFTQPQPSVSPVNGVEHGSEVLFVYGAPPDQSASARNLSTIMIDYWVSFATSLDPNDGKGVPKPNWAQYTPKNQVLMELNANSLGLIPDTYRAEQIGFINSIPAVFHH